MIEEDKKFGRRHIIWRTKS